MKRTPKVALCNSTALGLIVCLALVGASHAQENFIEQGTQTGTDSSAIGKFSEASGSASTAAGKNSVASGTYGTAVGYEADALGFSSTAFGFLSDALASSSTAVGAF